ncbi:MAG: tRNA lysidine(34) synthetase TilS, partial [Muribaculaceae bacterium]|nr:tRNA lysidine(34) synthetase TilS [Muribaculaceae bacterium]
MVEQRVASFFKGRGLVPGGRLAGVALSGGADSVALLAAMRSLGWACVALHCNFHLRGAESDRDARHARETAEALGCGFATVDFDVEARRKATGESVEMACRSLRYEWFERQAADLGLDFIAIAHHAGDSEETFLLNALRGTGLKGLCGIAPERGIYLRPMLDCRRDEVLGYLERKGIGYVTDSTNLVDDVGRNRVRLNILPAIRSDFPSASKGLARTMSSLRSDYKLLSMFVAREAERHVDGKRIALSAILADYDRDMAADLLYRLMKLTAGCEGDGAAARRVVASSDESGRYFAFGRRRFLLDRGVLVLLEEGEADSPDEIVPLDLGGLGFGVPLRIPLGGGVVEAELLSAGEFVKSDGRDTIWLDASAIE